MQDVVIERKTLTVNYEEPLKLMKDLKGLGLLMHRPQKIKI